MCTPSSSAAANPSGATLCRFAAYTMSMNASSRLQWRRATSTPSAAPRLRWPLRRGPLGCSVSFRGFTIGSLALRQFRCCPVLSRHRQGRKSIDAGPKDIRDRSVNRGGHGPPGGRCLASPAAWSACNFGSTQPDPPNRSRQQRHRIGERQPEVGGHLIAEWRAFVGSTGHWPTPHPTGRLCASRSQRV